MLEGETRKGKKWRMLSNKFLITKDSTKGFWMIV